MYEGELRSLHRLDCDHNATTNTIVGVSEPNIVRRSSPFGSSSVDQTDSERRIVMDFSSLKLNVVSIYLRPACRRNSTVRTGTRFICSW